MRRLRRWLGRALVLAVVLAAVGIVAAALYLRSAPGEAFLLAEIEAAVARAGGRLTAARMHVRSPGRLELEDVRLTFDGQSMLRADHAAIAWTPLALAWGEVRVSTLALARPRVRLVRRDGGWGFPTRDGRRGGGPRLRVRIVRLRVDDGRVAVGLDDGDEPTRIVLRRVAGTAGVAIGWRGTEVDVQELGVQPAGVPVPPLALRGGFSFAGGGVRIDAQAATAASTLALSLAVAEDGRIRLEAESPRLAAIDVGRVWPSWRLPDDVTLSVTADGPRDALATDAAIDVGSALALRATGTVDAAARPVRADLDLAGSHVATPQAGRVEAEALRVRGGVDPVAATVVGTLVVAGGRLAVDGRVRTDASGLDVRTTFEAADVEPWIGRQGRVRGAAHLAGGRLRVEVASAETPEVVASGTIDARLADGTATVDARIADPDVPGRTGRLAARVAGLRGAWTADVAIDAADSGIGSLRTSGRVERAPSGAVARLGTLAVARPGGVPWRLAGAATLRWDGTAITVDETTLVRAASRVRLRGRVRPRGRDDALDLAITAQAVDVADLAEWMPAGVESVAGRLDADLVVRGTFAAPTIDGTGRLDATRARVAGIGTLEDVRIRVRGRSGDRLVIESLAARAGTGTIEGSGTIGLTASGEMPIAAEIRLRRVPVVRRPLYRAVVDGRAAVDGTLAAPRFTADLRIPEGVVRPRLLPEEGANLGVDPTITVVGEPEAAPAPSAAAALAPVTIQATVALGDAVYIRRKDGEIRLEGRLALDKDPDGPLRISGPIEFAEGWYEFKGRRFDIRSGTLRFTGQPTPDPELQIRARHRARGYVVWVDVGGVASAPTLTLSSEPPLAEADVLAVLLFGRPASDLGDEQQDVVQREAQSVAISYAAPALAASARQVLPVDRVEVSGGEVLVARSVTQDIFISLSQDLTGRAGQTVGMEYDITPRTSLKLSTSSRGSSAIDFFWRRRY